MNVHDPKQVDACLKDPQCNVPFHQPGSASGHPRFSTQRLKTCPNMMARLFGDNPALKMTRFQEKCPTGTSKIALVVDPDEDYHFYRQDKDGMWSHKPGGMPVTNMDSHGIKIYDPSICGRNYNSLSSKLNYDTFCSYMCVPRVNPVHLKVGGRFKKTRRTRS